MNRLGLKWRIVLPIAAVLLAGIAALTVIIARDYRASMIEAMERNLEATAYRYANAIKADMEMGLGLHPAKRRKRPTNERRQRGERETHRTRSHSGQRHDLGDG